MMRFESPQVHDVHSVSAICMEFYSHGPCASVTIRFADEGGSGAELKAFFRGDRIPLARALAEAINGAAAQSRGPTITEDLLVLDGAA